MLNYDKMDDVLKNLDECVDDIKEISKTQETLEGIALKMNEAIFQINDTKNIILKNVENIELIEKKHEDIERNIESVLQDYKKIHSAFEYVEIETKKTTAQLEALKINQEEKIDGLKRTLEEIEEKRKEQNGLTLFVTLSSFIAILILTIINFFV